MDSGDAIEQEYIQQRFLELLSKGKLQEAFDIYESVDREMKDRLFHFLCGAFSSSYEIMSKLIESLKGKEDG